MITLGELAAAIGADPPDRPETTVGRFVIDSREAKPGDLFFALEGDHTHGGRFAGSAEQQHAIPIVPPDFAAPGRLVIPDVESALRTAAAMKRERFTGTVVGIAGSVGKTTTRRLIAAVLCEAGKTIQSPGNFNNELGVPITLGLLTNDTKFAVVEIASSAPGEIAELAASARPDAAVITPLAAAHLDGLGDVNGVRREKWSLADAVPNDGVVVSATDPPVWLNRPVTVTRSSNATTDGKRTTFDVAGEVFTLQMPGVHLADLGALAVTIGREFELSTLAIQRAIASVASRPGRCHAFDVAGIRVIDDTYNSCPAALAAAFQLLCSTPAKRRFAALGDMLGLGPDAERLHREVVIPSGVDTVFTTGPSASLLVPGVSDPGKQPTTSRTARNTSNDQAFASVDALVKALIAELCPGDAVLVKGSRDTRMERVVAAIQKQRARSVSE